MTKMLKEKCLVSLCVLLALAIGGARAGTNTDFVTGMRYVLDYTTSGTYLETTPVLLGETDMTFEVLVSRSGSATVQQQIFAWGSDASLIGVDMATNGKLIARIGSETFTTTFVALPTLRTWYTISLRIGCFGNLRSKVSIATYATNPSTGGPMLVGEETKTLTRGPPTVGYRAGVYGDRSSTSFQGLIDNIRIWNYWRASEDTLRYHNNPDFLLDTDLLILYFPISESRGPWIAGMGQCNPLGFTNAKPTNFDLLNYAAVSTAYKCAWEGDPHTDTFRGPHIDWQPWGCFQYALCNNLDIKVLQWRDSGSRGANPGDTSATASASAGTVVVWNTWLARDDPKRVWFSIRNWGSTGSGAPGWKWGKGNTVYTTFPGTDHGVDLNGFTISRSGGEYSTYTWFFPGYLRYVYHANAQSWGKGVITIDTPPGGNTLCANMDGYCGKLTASTPSGFNYNYWRIADSNIHNIAGDAMCPYWDNHYFETKGQPMPAVAPTYTDPCVGLPDTFVASVNETCKCSNDALTKHNCRLDGCSTGSLAVAATSCLAAVRRCEEAAVRTPTLQNLADCPLYCADGCNGRGTCVRPAGETLTKCICQTGWTGSTCQWPTSFVEVRADYNLENNDPAVPAQNNRPFMPVWDATVKDLSFKNSILFYVSGYRATDTSASVLSLIVKAEIKGTLSTDASETFHLNVAGSEFTPSLTNANTVFLHNSSNLQNGLPQSLAVTVDLSSSVLIDQVLLGMASRTVASLIDVVKLMPTSENSNIYKFKLTLTQGTDSCSTWTTCKQCEDADGCGWCREVGTCMKGDPSGPLRDGCKNWRYSRQDTVSRRLTTTTGLAVDPPLTEIYLAPVTDTDGQVLPIQVALAGLRTDAMGMDVVFLVEYQGSSHLTGIFTKIGSWATSSLIRYSVYSYPGSGTDALQEQTEGFVSGTTQPKSQSYTASPEANPLIALNNAFAVKSNDWGKGRRRFAVLFPKTNVSPTQDVTEARNALLKSAVMPVVYADSTTLSSFDTLVKTKFHFGLAVVPSSLTDLMNAAMQTMSMAVVNTDVQGHIVTPDNELAHAMRQMHDIPDRSRAVFTFELGYKAHEAATANASELAGPGFGFATIENVLTDRPTLTSPSEIYLLKNPVIPGTSFPGSIVTLSGCGYRSYPVKVTAWTEKAQFGVLYQYNAAAAALGNNPTGLAFLSNTQTAVTDPMQRVVYIPVRDAFSSSFSEPYDTIFFQMDDGCTDLGYVAKVDIYIRSDSNYPIGYNDSLTVVDEDSGWSNVVLQGDDAKDFALDWSIGGTTATSQYRTPNGGNVSTTAGVFLMQKANFSRSVKVTGFRQNTTVRYSPNLNFNGNDSIQFKVSSTNEKGERIQSTLTSAPVQVRPINDAPVAKFEPFSSNNTYTFDEDTPLALNFSYEDVESQNVEFKLTWDENLLRGSLYTSNPGVGQNVSSNLADPNLNPRPTNSVTRLSSGWTSSRTPSSAKLSLWYLPRFGENTPAGSPYFQFNWALTETTGGLEVDHRGYPYNRTSVNGVVSLNVTPVPDPPFLPSVPLTITLSEDTPSNLVLDGKQDYDTDLSNVSILISRLPSRDRDMILKQLNGVLITSSLTVVTQSDTISVQGVKDAFGDATKSWYYGSFGYQAKDNTNMLSNERTVSVTILPVNDPPQPACNRKIVVEDDPLYPTGTPFFLESPRDDFTDVDTDFVNMTFRVLSLPNPNGAVLKHYANLSDVKPGDIVPLVAFLNPVTGVNELLPWLRVLPRRDWYSNDTVHCLPGDNSAYPCFLSFSYDVTDKDTNGRNTQSFTVACTSVELRVTPVNDAPIGTFVATPGLEDTPLVLTLSGWDIENDTLQAIVSQLPAKGTLFQYAADANGNLLPLASLQRLVKVGSVYPVTDPQWRVIYWPPANANSDLSGRVESFKLYPEKTRFKYFMNETRTHWGLLYARSLDVQGNFFINPVNDAPYVYDPSRQAFTSQVALCWKNCDYREDLGLVAPAEPGPIQLYMGGGDIELDDLRVIVTSIECHQESIFRNKKTNGIVDTSNLAGTATVPVAGVEPNLQPEVLHAILDFRPPRDANDIRFCNVTYTVQDYGLMGVDSRTITIDLDPVNDAPRFLEGEDAVFTYEQVPLLIKVKGFDVEGQVFTAEIMGCVEGAGTVWLSNEQSEKLQEYDCGSGTRMALPGDSESDSWYLLFVPNNDTTPPTEGPTYNRIALFMSDNSAGGQGIYSIKIAVLPLNDPPLILVLDEKEEEVTIFSQQPHWTGDVQVGFESDVSLGKTTDSHDLVVHDVDIRSSKYRVKLTVSVEAEEKDADHGRLILTFPTSSPAALSVPAGKPDLADHTDLVIKDTVTVEFDADESVLNQVLSTATLHTGSYKATYTFKLVANDQGRTGGCLPLADGTMVRSCPQEATIVWTINNDPSSGLGVSEIVGISAGATGAFMIAGAGAWRKMRNPPTEDYEPWLFEDADVGVANPLYKDAGLTGANPLYQDTPI